MPDESNGFSPDVVAITTSAGEPVLPAPAPVVETIEMRMLRLMETMEGRMAALEAENKVLRSQAEQNLIDETPNHLKSERRGNLAPGEDRFARRVVVATAAADIDFVNREIPQAQGRIVDAGGLVRNTLERIQSGEDREDA